MIWVLHSGILGTAFPTASCEKVTFKKFAGRYTFSIN